VTTYPDDLSKHLIKLQAGDKQSFRVVYETHVSSLHAFVFRFTKSTALTDDIIQEVFIKIWENRGQLDPSKSFKAFLYKIAKNQVLNVLARYKTEETMRKEILVGAERNANVTEQELEFQEMSEVLQEGIAQLPSQQRKIFELCKTQGLTYEEAASQLNLSTSTINSQMVNALRFLKNYLISKGSVAMVLLPLIHP
jgi:RNA polymerase sigma-70 factor (family 1)